MTAPLITRQKELAAALNRTPRFVHHMQRRGFKLPATLDEAVIFLRKNPHPCRRKK